MAEIPMSGPSGTGDMRRSVGTVANYAGAAVSLALVFGIGAWGYSLLARDVSGVPVVKAAAVGPMRIVPEKPGGAEAAHQGLSVNRVMAEGSAEKPADKLVLAPNPVELIEEDTPLEIRAVRSSVVNASTQESVLPELGLGAADEPMSEQMASIKAFADQLASGAAPLEQGTPTPAQEGEATAEVTQVAAVAPVELTTPVVEVSEAATAGLKRSLRPKMRPVLTSAAATPAAPVVEVASSSAIEVDIASITAGTRLVQLGAFDSPDVARKEWARLSTRFEDYMDGKQRVVMRAKSGGRVFYRLRATGFADLNDARRFCAALVAAKADCIPVVSK